MSVNSMVGDAIYDVCLSMIVESSLHLCCRVVSHTIQNSGSKMVGNRTMDKGSSMVS